MTVTDMKKVIKFQSPNKRLTNQTIIALYSAFIICFHFSGLFRLFHLNRDELEDSTTTILIPELTTQLKIEFPLFVQNPLA